MICQTNDVRLHKEVRSFFINYIRQQCIENVTNIGLPSHHRGRGDEAVEVDDSRLPSVTRFKGFQRYCQEISEIPCLTRVEHEVEVLNKQSVSAAVPAEAAARSEEINSAIRAFEQIETTANDNPNDNQEPE